MTRMIDITDQLVPDLNPLVTPVQGLPDPMSQTNFNET